LGLGLAAFAVWAAFKNTGHKRHAEDEVAAVAPPEKPVVIPIAAARPPEAKAAGVAAEPGPPVASADVGAPRAASPRAVAARHAAPSAHETSGPMLDERMADPKLARALPAEFPRLLAACRQAFTEKRGKDAETACLAAKDANPDSAEACALLGHALFNRKKRREALPWAERAVALDPRRADAYVIIGGVKQAAGDPASAKAAYKKYLELEPTGQYAADLRAIVDSL
jgi:tetratricopeptide (TPR) repeat protein